MNVLISSSKNTHFGVSVLIFLWLAVPAKVLAQGASNLNLERMPVQLETDFALSALPKHLRSNATVYLLDPSKGYYVAQNGSNGFICFISRTEWEWGEFRNDLAVPMSYDAEGAKTVFLVYIDVAAMRASGKFTALEVRDSVIARINNGIYKAPSKGGISYMLAPIMRAYATNPGDKSINTISVPHSMFYAPYLTNADLGITSDSHQNFILGNPGDYVLGKGKGPYGNIIFPVTDEEKATIVKDNEDMIKRLVDYKPYFKTENGNHHHS